ncbi:uncharacterized protein METZ01_LOCUS395263, partial [marine metagenome]
MSIATEIDDNPLDLVTVRELDFGPSRKDQQLRREVTGYL